MRPTLAWLPLGALPSAGSTLIGYNFDGYGPAGSSTGGSSGVGGGEASTSGVGMGGGEASTSGATGVGGAASCTRFNAVSDTAIKHASKLLIVADLAGPGASEKDRLPDVVVASDIALQTSVLYNNGNKLNFGKSLGSMMIGAPSNITFGDMDANGLPDLVELSAPAGQASYALNKGNEFADWQSLSLETAGMPLGAVTSAQIDDLGPEDIVVAAGTKLTTFLFGPTGVVLPMTLERSLPFEATALEVAKLDDDKVNDYVVMSTAMSQIAIIFGTSDPKAQAIRYSVVTNPKQLGLADFDGNGALDIVTSSAGSTQVSLLLNDGKGVFSPLFVEAGMQTGGLAADDYDGDGHQDLALSGDGKIVVLLGKGDGTFRSPIKFSGLSHSNVLRAADMNGDKKPDLVEGSDTESKVRVYLNCN